MSLARPVIVWFRQDLRVADNPALVAAAQTGQPVLPVYLWSPGAEADWPAGADAAPYFRVFNPVRQSERFDPKGVYLRRWLPELAALDDRELHAPWKAPAARLRAAGVRLGIDYPQPLLDHAAAHARAGRARANESTRGAYARRRGQTCVICGS